MILVIDNYDSFTYNLVQIIENLYPHIRVIKNDELSISEIVELNPKGIVISPGPSTPQNAGICLDVVKLLGKTTPIFGVCLGHQTIAEAFGCKITKAKAIVHGKVDSIYHNGQGIYTSITSPFSATRYHSLIVAYETITDVLEITSTTLDKTLIMGIKHKVYPIEGVQFHPESYKTEQGQKLIENFINSILLERTNL